MNHQQVLKSALHGLPAEQAGYLTDLGQFIEEHEEFERNRHWMFMILAACCEMVPTVLPKEIVAKHLADFVVKHLGTIQRIAYSREYILKKGQPLAELATEYAAYLSIVALEDYKAGKIESDEPNNHVFRWPYYDEEAFPYHDDDDLDDEEEDGW